MLWCLVSSVTVTLFVIDDDICSRFDVFCNIVAYNVNINSLVLCCILALQTTLQVCIVVSVLFNALCKMLMAS